MRKRTKLFLIILPVCLLLAFFGWRWYGSYADRSGRPDRDGVTANRDPAAQQPTDSTCCPIESSVPASERRETEGERQCLSENGQIRTGWQEQGEYRYYLLPDGTVATGKQEIDGVTQYFTPDGVWVLLVNPWNPLPTGYAPELVETENGYRVAAECRDALEAMMAAMRQEGLLPMFSSAYRSKTHQASIWQSYVNRYLAAGYSEAQANAMTASYVAVPGTSEHHTGLAVDIVGYDYFYNGHYGSTKAVQAWLAEHCWEYGFILRYTEEKQPVTGFAEETWHFRYVGTRVSLPMKGTGLCLEEYLGATIGQ